MKVKGVSEKCIRLIQKGQKELKADIKDCKGCELRVLNSIIPEIWTGKTNKKVETDTRQQRIKIKYLTQKKRW